ncbi:alcohol dehydrogenase [Exophiala aquamarina CBS 119918]|uniref:Alcohol dehydrogenase n=1 Tax=Exophiala aquamarina CBS 119918 TaxID=1182545 RepID=A0A072PR94_9EURO|nr:alcohol dehydrogenase [Exophiala aquamarina CBS 119918]KEF62386.1 alcohol dehydrogenase [Exophiala aquamarina CBS 119918]
MSHKAALQASLESTKSEYKKLGKCGLRVSVPILGAMSFGDPGWQSWILDEEKGLPLLKAAYDRGLNTWDTANIYSNGKSEEIIAKALKTYKIPRDKVVILTKCFAYIGEEYSYQNEAEMPKTKDYVNHGGLSRQAIFQAVDASLKRLDTPYIDLLQIHRFDNDVPIEETMEALHDLVRSGKVRYIGASSVSSDFAMMQHSAEIHGWTKFVSMQNHYNLLYREEEREMNKFCDLTGVGLIPWAPLCRGILARPPSADKTERSSQDRSKTGYSDVDKQIVKRVQEVAEKRGWKMSHVALAWINKRIASPIIGFSSVERMDEALEIRGKELTAEEEKYLEELYEARSIEGHS